MQLSTDEKIARLKIIRGNNIGTHTFWNIIELYGTAENALLSLNKISNKSSKKFQLASDEHIESEIQLMKTHKAKFVFFEDKHYPPLLRNISNPPPVLIFKGNPQKLESFYNGKLLAIVGSRNASIHANNFCKELCKKLGENDVITVSGMARGIDTYAHQASLESGTIAIMASGIDTIYPPENKKLYELILEKGGIFTEMPCGTMPQPKLFPRRNRIIAGISMGTLIIEAMEKSGSLITAKMAMEYNRDVFAVPGFPADPRSVGCNALIKDGAILVRNHIDIIENLTREEIIPNSLFETRKYFSNKISDIDVEKNKSKILDSLNSVPITIDELINHIDISPQEALSAMLELELSGKIARLHGQKICVRIN